MPPHPLPLPSGERGRGRGNFKYVWLGLRWRMTRKDQFLLGSIGSLFKACPQKNVKVKI